MDTIILFGASRGGVNFIKNHQGEYNIAAFVDNDSKKQGRMIHDIPIIAPNQISLFSYDYIVITSMYVSSINEQLKKLNIQEDKIKFAPKKSMKIDELPFENPTTLKKTNRLILEISQALKNQSHFYTFGTLLGIARDGGLIPWDDDIDIAIFAEDTKYIQKILLNQVARFEELFDIKLFVRMYSNGTPASLTMDCLESGRSLFMVNFDCMYTEGDIIKQELNDTPAQFFDGYDELDFKGTKIRAPKNYEGYLDYTYGDWRTVKKNTSFADNTISFREPLYSCTVEHLYESK